MVVEDFLEASWWWMKTGTRQIKVDEADKSTMYLSRESENDYGLRQLRRAILVEVLTLSKVISTTYE